MKTEKDVFIIRGNEDRTVVIAIQEYIDYNGQKTVVHYTETSLTPLDGKRAKELLAEPEYNAVMALWTPSVIKRWEEYQKELREEMNP